MVCGKLHRVRKVFTEWGKNPSAAERTGHSVSVLIFEGVPCTNISKNSIAVLAILLPLGKESTEISKTLNTEEGLCVQMFVLYLLVICLNKKFGVSESETQLTILRCWCLWPFTVISVRVMAGSRWVWGSTFCWFTWITVMYLQRWWYLGIDYLDYSIEICCSLL